MRILIAYGSSRGGTAGLAEMVAQALGRRGFAVEVGDAAAIAAVEGYDAVIVGGALYNNRWHADATDFVQRLAADLRPLPVWFFSSGPLDDSARSGALAPIPHVRELARRFDIRGHMTFGGVLAKRAGGRLSALLSYGNVGDWRDSKQVAQWAERIAAQLGDLRAIAIVLPDAVLPDTPLPDTPPPVRHGDDDAGPATEHPRLERFRRLLSSEEVEDDAGLDVLL